MSRRAIYEIVKRIPHGRVASYGRIARMAGCSARQVGYAMAAAPPDQNIPWQRVINRKGEISARKYSDGGENRQRQKLQNEGVVFDRDGRVDFARFGWEVGEELFDGDGDNVNSDSDNFDGDNSNSDHVHQKSSRAQK